MLDFALSRNLACTMTSGKVVQLNVFHTGMRLYSKSKLNKVLSYHEILLFSLKFFNSLIQFGLQCFPLCNNLMCVFYIPCQPDYLFLCQQSKTPTVIATLHMHTLKHIYYSTLLSLPTSFLQRSSALISSLKVSSFTCSSRAVFTSSNTILDCLSLFSALQIKMRNKIYYN